MRQTAGEFFQEDSHFHPADILAHALVAAVAEGQVINGIVPVDVEPVAVFEMAFVLVARCLNDEKLGPLRQLHTAEQSRRRCLSAPGNNRPGVAQTFLDRIGNEARVIADVFPGLAVAQQRLEHVGRGKRGGLMCGNDDRHHHGMHVAVGYHLRHLSVLADGFMHPAGAVRLLFHSLDDPARILPELPHGMSNRDLLFVGRLAPGVDGMRHGEGLENRDLVLGHAQKMQRDVQRHLVKQRVDQVDTAALDELIHFLARQPPHHLLLGFQVFRQKMIHQHPPPFHMRGLILVHHGPIELIAVALQNLHRFWRSRCDLLKGNARRIEDVVAKDRLDVLVAADNPVSKFLTEKYGQLRA